MVVRLVLEHQQPRLFLAVYGCLDADGARIDLFALVEVCQIAALLEHLAGSGADIHQRDRALCRLLLAIDLTAARQIAVKCILDHLVIDDAVVDLSQEGGVTAVVRPVGVDHAHLGDGRVALFLARKIALEELQVVQLHRQAETGAHVLQRRSVHRDKALDGVDRGRNGIICLKGFRLVRRRLAGVDRVDEIAADFIQLRVRQLAAEHIDMCRRDLRAFALRHQLNALCARIRALVILARQRLDRENAVIAFRHRELLIIAVIHHRLGEHNVLRLRIDLRVNALDIVSAQLAHIGERRNLQQLAHAAAQRLRCAVESAAFFSIAS